MSEEMLAAVASTEELTPGGNAGTGLRVQVASTADTASIRILFPTLMLIMLLAALDQTIVATALPTIAGDLGGLDALSWVVTAYLLASTVSVPIYGKLGDIYGRRSMLMLAVCIFLLGSALCGFAQNFVELVALRGLQGLGGGGLLVLPAASIGDVVSPARRGKYQGMFGAAYALAALIGPLAGGYLVEHLSWRWIFYINVPLGLFILAVIAAVFRPRHIKEHAPIDLAGIGLLALSLSAWILVAAVAGDAMRWPEWAHWAVPAVALLAMAGFVAVERHASEPLFPLALCSNRDFVVPCLVGFIVGTALFGSIAFLPLYLQLARGLTPTMAGMQLLPLLLGVVASSIISGRLASRLGKYRMFPIVGSLLAAIGMALLSTIDTRASIVTPYVVLLGLGLGMVLPTLVTAVQNGVPHAQLGIATSGLVLSRSVGGVAGVAILGAVFSWKLRAGFVAMQGGKHDLPAPSTWHDLPSGQHEALVRLFSHACSTVYLLAAAGLLLACLIATRLRGNLLRE